MSDNIKQSAERLRRWRLLGGMETEQNIWPGNSTARGIAIAEDQDAVMKAYLAEHLPDDNEPVTEEWLASQDFMPIRLSLGCEHLTMWNGDYDLDIEQVSDKPFTRGQVRQLVRCLTGEPNG